MIRLALCLLSVVGVKSMSLEGTPLTRYDPCGLGVVHFDRVAEKHWQAVVNLRLYATLGTEVSINVEFEDVVWIAATTHNTSIELRNKNHTYALKLRGDIPYRYIFFLKLDEDSSDDVPVVKKFGLNNFTLCDDAIKERQSIDSLDVTKDQEHYAHVCGRKALEHAEMTEVRSDAQAGDWPWHVALFVRDKNGDLDYQCGGNIISRTAILTAGHCVSNNGFVIRPERVVVVAGVRNHSNIDEPGRQEFEATEVILHPSYHDDYSTADLAIIKVNMLRYTKYVQPVCIWGPVYDKTNLFGYQATVVGFGTTENDTNSDVLRSAYIMVQNDTTCVDFSQKVYKPLMNEFTFCAGYGPKSSINPRNGDSGGGLVIPVMQTNHVISWFLRGVLSKCGVGPGEDDCNPTYYVVYTDVGPHYGWIYHHSGLQFHSNIKTNVGKP